MISVCDECEYSTLIADLIVFLGNLKKFKMRIWVSHSELPFTFNEMWEFHFLQEGMRASNSDKTLYLCYDLISLVELYEVEK